MPSEPTGEQQPIPGMLRAAALIGAVQAGALVVYAVAIGVAARQAGQDVAAAPVEIAIYLIFAVGIGLIARGLLHRRHIARGPFVVTQLFGLITGWTLTQGDGTAIHVAGIAVLLLSLAGIALALNSGVRDALVD